MIIITGGGHVGLSFALILASFDIKSVVIEKNHYNTPSLTKSDTPSNIAPLDRRNTALSRRTVQIYGEIGLWEKLASHACRIDSVHIYEKNSFGQATLKKEAEKVDSFGYVMENSHLGAILLQAVSDCPLIELIEGVAVMQIEGDVGDENLGDNFNANFDGVAVVLEDGRRIVGDLLVASDGQNSKIRQLLGIGTQVFDYHQSAIVGVVATKSPHHHQAIECFGTAGPLALLPLLPPKDNASAASNNYRSVVWIVKKGDEERYLNDDRLFINAIEQNFGERCSQVLSVGKRAAFALKKVIADKQVSGRAVLMGNAAHTLHPVAGQGFNLCMRDAYELAILCATKDLKAITEADLLAYEKCRLSDQKRVIFFCDGIIKGFGSNNWLVKFCRNIGLILFEYVPMIKPMVASFAMGLKHNNRPPSKLGAFDDNNTPKNNKS